MLGAIIGDIAGSIYDFDNYKAKDFETLTRPAADCAPGRYCAGATPDKPAARR